MKTSKSSANGETTETLLGDGSVNNSTIAESVEKALGDLVTEHQQSQHQFNEAASRMWSIGL